MGYKLNDSIESTKREESSLSKNQSLIEQLCLFSQQYSWAKLWIYWGVVPTLMVGHSLGEYVAACISGVVSVENAIDILVLRNQHLNSIPDGKMVVVQLSYQELQSYLTKNIFVSAINSENNCSLSGDISSINHFILRLNNEKKNCLQRNFRE